MLKLSAIYLPLYHVYTNKTQHSGLGIFRLLAAYREGNKVWILWLYFEEQRILPASTFLAHENWRTVCNEAYRGFPVTYLHVRTASFYPTMNNYHSMGEKRTLQ